MIQNSLTILQVFLVISIYSQFVNLLDDTDQHIWQSLSQKDRQQYPIFLYDQYEMCFIKNQKDITGVVKAKPQGYGSFGEIYIGSCTSQKDYQKIHSEIQKFQDILDGNQLFQIEEQTSAFKIIYENPQDLERYKNFLYRAEFMQLKHHLDNIQLPEIMTCKIQRMSKDFKKQKIISFDRKKKRLRFSKFKHPIYNSNLGQFNQNQNQQQQIHPIQHIHEAIPLNKIDNLNHLENLPQNYQSIQYFVLKMPKYSIDLVKYKKKFYDFDISSMQQLQKIYEDLTSIQFDLQNYGLLHNDLKPENFMLDFTPKNNFDLNFKVYLVDLDSLDFAPRETCFYTASYSPCWGGSCDIRCTETLDEFQIVATLYDLMSQSLFTNVFFSGYGIKSNQQIVEDLLQKTYKLMKNDRKKQFQYKNMMNEMVNIALHYLQGNDISYQKMERKKKMRFNRFTQKDKISNKSS